MAVHYVADVEEMEEGSRKIVQIRNLSIGVFRLKGEFHALLNYCPHIGAELCKGVVSGTNLESDVYEFIYGKHQEIIRCPWHGWEFDMKTGESLFDKKVRAKRFDVVIEDGKVGIVI